MEQKPKKLSFHLLALITTPKLADKAAELFRKGNLPLQYRFHAEGTVSNEIIDMLGLGGVDKCILITVIPKELSGVMLEKLRTELKMHSVNSGIAFTIPLNGISNLIYRMFEMNTQECLNTATRKEETQMSEMKNVLVAAVVNRGFSSDVMDVARSAGARGGTVIQSRHIVNEEAAGFWGITVQDEKEIVLIIADADKKVAIMQNIGEHCGMHSEAKGVVMSMPIDSVIGM